MLEKFKQDLEITPHVFVYGSLKKGYWNNDLLKEAEFICEGQTIEESLKLYSRPSSFPYMVFNKDKDFTSVIGEVYEISPTTLEFLDFLEGVDHGHYRRGLVDVKTQDNSTILCWTYFAAELTIETFDNMGIKEIEPIDGVYQWI